MKVPGIPYVQGKNAYTDADGKKYAIAIHNTSNNASDENEASYAQRRTDGVSSHFYCDEDSVIQSIDTNDRVGHAGSGNGNNNALAVEITGGNGQSRQWWIDNVAWDKLCQVLAYVIKNDPDLVGFQVRRASVSEMISNPKVKAFYAHDDMRRAWGGTTHTDPGPNFPWDHFLAKMKAALSGNVSTVGSDDDMFCKRGDTGEKVQAVQYRLQLLGFYKGELDADYGPATQEAVKAARASVGSVQDGSVYDAHAMVQIELAFARKFGVGAVGPQGPQGPKGDPGGLSLPMTVVINKA